MNELAASLASSEGTAAPVTPPELEAVVVRLVPVVLAVVSVTGQEGGHIVGLARHQIKVIDIFCHHGLAVLDCEVLLDSLVRRAWDVGVAEVLPTGGSATDNFAVVDLWNTVDCVTTGPLVPAPLLNGDVVEAELVVPLTSRAATEVLFSRDSAVCIPVMALEVNLLRPSVVPDIDAGQVVGVVHRVADADGHSDFVPLKVIATFHVLRVQILNLNLAEKVVFLRAVGVTKNLGLPS